MGINVRCIECKRDYKLSIRYCSHCNKPLSGRDRKYKVVVRTPEGKRIVRLVDTLELAKKIEGSHRGKIAEKKHLGIIRAPNLDTVWQQYKQWSKMTKKSWKDDHSRWTKHVAHHVQGRKMDTITPFEIERILAAMNDVKNPKSPTGRGYKPATLRNVQGLIRGVYNWAIRRGLYQGPNPAEKVQLPKFDNRVTQYLTKEQIVKLLEVLESWPQKPLALIVKFALYTGLRQAEITGLKWQEVDKTRGLATIKDAKGIIANTLPLNESAQAVLEEARQLADGKSPWCFPNNSGGRKAWCWRDWKNLRDAAGLPKSFRFHDLRHTFATYLASSGKVDLYTLQKLLTHKSPQMTQRYAHLMDEALRRGADVAVEVFSN